MSSTEKITETQKKNIDWAADCVAEAVFYHNNDSSQKERLKTALKVFAYMVINVKQQLDKTEPE